VIHRENHKQLTEKLFPIELLKTLQSPVDCSGRHEDSCGIAAAKLRPRRSNSDEETQRRPAESEVPVTKINSPIRGSKQGFKFLAA
jgi:hypothetical protein